MYIPYLLARVESAYSPTSTGLNTLLDYDYMGSSEFEWGAIPKSNTRTREAITGGETFTIVKLLARPSAGFVQGSDLYALLSTKQLATITLESLNSGITAVMDGTRRCKERVEFDRDFCLWHDIQYDIYFSTNTTFLNLVYSILSRPMDYATTVDKTLCVGDTIKLAIVLNGKSFKTVFNMHTKEGRVAAILDDTVVIKTYKSYRMPYAFIITHELEVQNG